MAQRVAARALAAHPRSAVGLLDDTPDGAQAQALPEAESPVAALRAELEATAREDDETGANSGSPLPFWSKETKV